MAPNAGKTQISPSRNVKYNARDAADAPDPRLAAVAARWADLPEPTKRAIERLAGIEPEA